LKSFSINTPNRLTSLNIPKLGGTINAAEIYWYIKHSGKEQTGSNIKIQSN